MTDSVKRDHEKAEVNNREYDKMAEYRDIDEDDSSRGLDKLSDVAPTSQVTRK